MRMTAHIMRAAHLMRSLAMYQRYSLIVKYIRNMECMRDLRITFSVPTIFWFNPLIMSILNKNYKLLLEAMIHKELYLNVNEYKDLLMLFQGMHSTNEANELEKRYLKNVSIQ